MFFSAGQSPSVLTKNCRSFIVAPDDTTTFNEVQSRFAVKVGELPDEIDLTAYMPKPGVKEKYDD